MRPSKRTTDIQPKLDHCAHTAVRAQRSRQTHKARRVQSTRSRHISHAAGSPSTLGAASAPSLASPPSSSSFWYGGASGRPRHGGERKPTRAMGMQAVRMAKPMAVRPKNCMILVARPASKWIGHLDYLQVILNTDQEPATKTLLEEAGRESLEGLKAIGTNVSSVQQARYEIAGVTSGRITGKRCCGILHACV